MMEAEEDRMVHQHYEKDKEEEVMVVLVSSKTLQSVEVEAVQV
jgi:hypothetical protein